MKNTLIFGVIVLFLFSLTFAQNETCKQLGEDLIEVDDECCIDLISKNQISWFDDNCTELPVGGSRGICIACGDGTCNSEYESECNCPEDCETCEESWDCTDWSDCENSTQTRTCTDLNSCGTEDDKPIESQTCETICEDDEDCETGYECEDDVCVLDDDEDDDETEKVCCKMTNNGKVKYNSIEEGSCTTDTNGSNVQREVVDDDMCEDDDNDGKEKNRLMREFNARDGSRIQVEKTVTFEDGKRVTQIIKKIIRPDNTEIEVKIKILEKTLKIQDENNDTYEAETELEIEEEESESGESEIKAKMSNGNKAKIKILPDKAYEITIEKLKTKNFTLELKEKEHKNTPKVIYNIESEKNGRFLGIFKMKVKIEGEIDPETGEYLGTDKPWWAFLVAGENSDQTGE